MICPLFMLIITRRLGSEFIGFVLGFALSLSLTLFIGGITATILYRSKLLKVISCLLSIIGYIGVILILWFYLMDGYDMKIDVMIPSERFPHNITNDPSLNGNYSYSFLTYGSGFDERIDYGIKASIKTPTIDLSSIIKLSSSNKKIFKYNESTLPLNGRIWYPTNNTNPYPVVLMVHGNHLPTESSETGYEYLGKMLASQGFIAVSIDENFLNGGSSFFSSIEYGKISKIKKYSLSSSNGPEFIARSIIILETLQQFRLWNEQKTNEFYNKFDLSNIGLMGHSRGGEAIVIAYLFNKLNFLPDYPSDILFNNYNFGIKVLFSIGGTDDGYMPLGRSLQLYDVTMLAIHGIYDGDVTSFLFQSKLTNLKFTSNTTNYNFKASLYVHQANHGQFNRNWGRYDLNPGINQFINVRPIMTMEEQQHISKIYMSALMNFVLKNQTHYRLLFEDYRSGLLYLPYTNYISTFQDSNEIIIADFENYDVTVGTIIGSKINITNLLLWSSVYVEVYRSSMLLLQSIENSIGKYTIHLQNTLNGSHVRFMIGCTPDGLADNLSVILMYENETNDSFIVHVLPALTKQVFKISFEEYVTALQTISLPLSHPIIGLEFVINGTNAQFLIDNIVVVIN
ncbi:unnamed protein product [Rotaria sordida]|uniref:Uncharacterized protein n=1 Tax=Rotaria sordida TaxID=392033 RepID=A0A819CEV4_9BILA|nr:unnamed protein product [Rotaria sordida]CAF3817894.1 unnamed protein product [Rotaria sordida]